MGERRLKGRLLDGTKWVRIVYMVLFALLLPLVNLVFAVSTLLQVILTLFTDQPNKYLQQFGSSLGLYLQQIAEFQLWNSDYKPFPFEHWPSVKVDTKASVKSSSKKAASAGSNGGSTATVASKAKKKPAATSNTTRKRTVPQSTTKATQKIATGGDTSDSNT